MAKNNDYQKLQKHWGEPLKKQRAAEKVFYEQTEDAMRHRKKSVKKHTPRSSHKHQYVSVIKRDTFAGTPYQYVTKACAVCGRLHPNDWKWAFKAQRKGETVFESDLPIYEAVDRQIVMADNKQEEG